MNTVGLTLDLRPRGGRVPAPGDGIVSILRSGAPGSGYVITDSREVRRRDPKPRVPRFAIRAVRVSVQQALAIDGEVWGIRWYSRSRRRR